MTTTTHSHKHWTDKGGHVIGIQPVLSGIRSWASNPAVIEALAR